MVNDPEGSNEALYMKWREEKWDCAFLDSHCQKYIEMYDNFTLLVVIDYTIMMKVLH